MQQCVATSHRRRLGGAFTWLSEHRSRLLAALALGALAVGGVLHLAGAAKAADDVWRAAIVILAAELLVEVAHTVFVDRRMGVDTIALVAMIGCLALGEYLAGIIVGLMFSGGGALEDWAASRAKRELTELIERAPKVAQLRRGDVVDEVPVDEVQIGDVVLVRTGEVVPVDGKLVSDEAVLDTSTLSGEPLPETVSTGMDVLSGAANAGAPFDLRASRPAAESSYAALVRLVEQSQAERAPFVRMADRCRSFPAGDPADRWRRMGDQRRGGPGALGRRGRDAVPADPRGADRSGLGGLAGGQIGGDREGDAGNRETWRVTNGAVR